MLSYHVRYIALVEYYQLKLVRMFLHVIISKQLRSTLHQQDHVAHTTLCLYCLK